MDFLHLNTLIYSTLQSTFVNVFFASNFSFVLSLKETLSFAVTTSPYPSMKVPSFCKKATSLTEETPSELKV